ncbi:MAG: TetR/AcrR family transcriptional regulator [Saprospiraceae bacterium]
MSSAGNTEGNIVEAARKVFMQKGFAATRMCDIALAANINQALLHYYFRTKEKLFQIIFDQESRKFLSNMTAILRSDLPFFDKLRLMLQKDLEKLRSAPYLPIFVLNEMHSNPNRIPCRQPNDDGYGAIFQDFSELVRQEQQAGRIRPVCPRQLLLSIQAIMMFPYLAQPMVKMSLGLDQQAFEKLMAERAEHASDLIIRGLQV